MGSLEAQGCFNEKGEPFLRIVTDDGDIVELQDEKIIKPIYALIRQFHDLLESALTEVEGGRH
jgi:hypothetical protein